jgi:hypothetical protein
MKIGVIGTINRDTIRFPDGTASEGYGGILYNLITLNSLTQKEDRIIPVCNIGSDCYRAVMAIIERMPSVSIGGINRVPEKNNHCYLTYHDLERKSEVLRGGVRPLKFDNVVPLLDCDMVLVNYISGRDIHLRSLRKFRRLFTGEIYMDIHSLTLGKRRDGSRYLRIPPSWPETSAAADYLQMNRRELKLLSDCRGGASNNLEISVDYLMRNLLRSRIAVDKKVLIITDGADGCYLFFYRSGRLVGEFIPVRKRARRGNTTGCGDCFAAGFVFARLQGRALRDCAERGNRAGYDCIMDRSEFQKIIKS